MNSKLICFFLFLMAFFSVQAEESPLDPLDSPSWKQMHELMLNNGPVVFDDKVIVNSPDFAEDALNVPVSIQADALSDIEEIVVFADLNPIQKILRFEPINIRPYLSFRIKVEQATPIRAAARTSDGLWHVGGKWLDAAGGGCTAPSHGRVSGDWFQNLMDVKSRAWFKQEEISRVRFRIKHPMDTGLAPGIPEFYLETLDIFDEQGTLVGKLDVFEPVSENPVFTLDVNQDVGRSLILKGRDNNGNLLETEIK